MVGDASFTSSSTNNRPLITEWYVNRAEGIEQGFNLVAPPGERRKGERLKMRLEVEGDLKARLADEGQAVDLIARGGERSLRICTFTTPRGVSWNHG